MGRDFAVFNLNEIGLRRFAFPLQTPKIQRTRRETDFLPKNAVFTLKIIDALPQKVKDGVAPNYQRYMPKKLAQGLCFQFLMESATMTIPLDNLPLSNRNCRLYPVHIFVPFPMQHRCRAAGNTAHTSLTTLRHPPWLFRHREFC